MKLDRNCRDPRAAVTDGHTSFVTSTTDDDYLRKVETLAHDVVRRALDEGWLSYAEDPPDATELHRAVNELARYLRHVHYDGDGCVDHQR